MSKLSIIQREKKRFFLFNKYNKKIKYFNKNIEYLKNNKIEFLNFKFLRKKIPRNSNGTRIRNRCFLTGRPRGVFRIFGLSRMMIKKISFKGYIPGILKSCW